MAYEADYEVSIPPVCPLPEVVLFTEEQGGGLIAGIATCECRFELLCDEPFEAGAWALEVIWKGLPTDYVQISYELWDDDDSALRLLPFGLEVVSRDDDRAVVTCRRVS